METMRDFKPFGLTLCNKKSIRHRTLLGNTIYYHTYFEPKYFDKYQRRNAIDEFKHPTSKENKIVSESMIEYALDEFFKVHSINEFDVVCGLPSSSGVVKNIIKKIQTRHPSISTIPKLFDKTRIRNVLINERQIADEPSEKTHDLAPKALRRSKFLHYDKVAKVSLFPTRFRRYVNGFLKLKPEFLPNITGKKVLLIDDTIGEGITLCEANSLLKPHASNVIGFTVMKDVSNKSKLIRNSNS